MAEIPDDVLDRAAELTRQARTAVDDGATSAYLERRDEILADLDFLARVREEPDGAVLVCYPANWVDDDGVVRPETVSDTDVAAEVRLDGRGAQGDWESAEASNRALVERVREGHGEVHANNAEAFADFMGNHYARPIETATATEVREFLEEYYPRNAWPTPEQAEVVEESLRYVFEAADEPYPLG